MEYMLDKIDPITIAKWVEQKENMVIDKLQDDHIKYYMSYHLSNAANLHTYKKWLMNHDRSLVLDLKVDNRVLLDEYKELFQRDDKYAGMIEYDEVTLSWDDTRENGTDLHKYMENYFNGINEIVPEKFQKEYNFFLDFVRHHVSDVYKPYRTEWRIFHPILRIAGSIDLIMQNDDGSIDIYDYKRIPDVDVGNGYLLEPLSHLKATKRNKYSVQLNLYAYILEKVYGYKVRFMYLLLLHPDNDTYMKVEIEKMEQAMHLIIQHFFNNT